MAESGVGEQLALVRTRMRPTRRTPVPAAATDPVASVALDVSLPHLDRPFDYEVPADLAERAVPGVRVRVRLAGRLVDGFVLSRTADSEHDGLLQRLSRVVSPEPVLTPEVLQTAQTVARRYAGTLADVLRAAVPPRHARAERAADGAPRGRPRFAAATEGASWADYPSGPALLRRAADLDVPAPRAVWACLPATDWTVPVRDLSVRVAAAGGGVLVIVPDARDVARVTARLLDAAPREAVTALTADLGPERRYRAFLDVLRGSARIVVGTRAAVFAPVQDLRLMVVWDDGDDLLEEQHAPYWHAREVAVLRSRLHGCALVLGGFARTTRAQQLVASGWARAVDPARTALRRYAPRVRAIGDDVELARDPAAASARLPHLAWDVAREGLARGPVLVQVPRSGYVPAVACQGCRELARCPDCAGTLHLPSGDGPATCVRCGRAAAGWVCPHCRGRALRAVAVGSARTAEELGQAFPGVAVVVSGGATVRDRVGERPALVVSTPGAEPVADGGYAAVLLLDARRLLERPRLQAGEEAVRRWLAAAALSRPRAPVVVTADNGLSAVQCLVRWDPSWYAGRELADRAELDLPPAAKVVALTGPRNGVAGLLGLFRPPPHARTLGPVPWGRAATSTGAEGSDRVRVLITVPRADGTSLVDAVRGAVRVASARRDLAPVEVRVDPGDLG